MKDLFKDINLPKELNDTLAEGRCVDFIFENYQIMRCMQQYLYDEMLKPANVLDFVDYTAVYNVKLAFAHHFRSQIIHDSKSLMLYSEV